MRSATRLLVFCALVGAAMPACSGRKSGTPAPRHDLITNAQMREHGFYNAYDAVAALHPNWLLTKGTDSFRSPGQVQVYFDTNRLGGIETLRNIATPSVVYIRHYDGIAASARWGLDHSHGAIYVSSQPDDGP